MLTRFLPIAVVALLSLFANAQQTAGTAKLIDLNGEVQVQLPHQTLVSASREMLLPPGTKIATGKGSAVLVLSDGSQVLVKGNSNVLLKSPEESTQSFLELLLGKIRASVTKRVEGAPSFQLGTPTAVITVRGTKFEVRVDKHLSTSVQVFEGLVEVSGRRFSAPVLLGPGYFTRVREDEPAETPQSVSGTQGVARRGSAGDSGGPSRGTYGPEEGEGRRSSNGPAGANEDGGEHEHEFE